MEFSLVVKKDVPNSEIIRRIYSTFGDSEIGKNFKKEYVDIETNYKPKLFAFGRKRDEQENIYHQKLQELFNKYEEHNKYPHYQLILNDFISHHSCGDYDADNECFICSVDGSPLDVRAGGGSRVNKYTYCNASQYCSSCPKRLCALAPDGFILKDRQSFGRFNPDYAKFFD